ncbi:DUF6454 family protein, partial [Phenylobacterium sp.]|uniref:DUF6454 family protein n=1 Tax=Phenylobacterium sp. TaxID=1871053 RepID=UPI00286D2EB6
MRALTWLRLAALSICVLVAPAAAAPPNVAARVMQLDRRTTWTEVSATPVGFKTHHPQGMVRIGPDTFVSSVEILTYTKRYPTPQGGFDRDQGAGRGHLFRIGPDGALLGDLVLGEGAIYHPGGLDFDGEFLWVAVAEYRPNSASIIYRVDPRSLRAVEVLRVADHIGAVAYDRERQALIGVNWGGRAFYRWPMRRGWPVAGARAKPIANRASYVDYQDCHFVGGRRMLCSGLASYPTPMAGFSFTLGGFELVDVDDFRPTWQAPVSLWTKAGRAMTQNPFFVEATPRGLRASFMPDDNRSTIFVYEAVLD